MTKWFYLLTLPSAYLYRSLKGNHSSLFWLMVVVLLIEQAASYAIEIAVYDRPFTHWFDYIFTCAVAAFYLVTAGLFEYIKRKADSHRD